jgi:cation:H+ antiporter
LISIGASALLVTRLERVAARFQMREAVLGLVVALAADGPEITAAVAGLLRGQRDLAVGVVLGSNAFNLAALLGLGALSAGRIRLHRDVMVFAGAVALAIALLAVATAARGVAPAAALGIALAFLVPYVAVSATTPSTLARWRLPRGFGARLAGAVADEEAELAAALSARRASPVDVATAAGALVLVVAASVVLEHAASTVGSHYAMPQILTGGVVLAAITSLPNAVGAIYLARRARGSAVLSTALNSNSINVVFGLLLPGTILGLARPSGAALLVACWYATMTVGSLALAYRGRGLDRVSGAAVVCAYLALVGLLAVR